MVRRSRTLAVLVVATLTTGLAAAPARASATTPVSTIAAGAGVSWLTPVERTAQVGFASTTTRTSASTVITLKDASAPTSYPFQFQLPAGSDLVATDDGGFDVVNESGGVGIATAHIDVPWAHDAKGNSLRTWFSLIGTSLVQHIDTTNATFPVTADPKITWGWVTGTIYFNKRETADIATGFGAAVALLGTIPEWGSLILIRLGITIVTVAQTLVNHGICMKIKLPLILTQSYTGGYCK